MFLLFTIISLLTSIVALVLSEWMILTIPALYLVISLGGLIWIGLRSKTQQQADRWMRIVVLLSMIPMVLWCGLLSWFGD